MIVEWSRLKDALLLIITTTCAIMGKFSWHFFYCSTRLTSKAASVAKCVLQDISLASVRSVLHRYFYLFTPSPPLPLPPPPHLPRCMVQTECLIRPSFEGKQEFIRQLTVPTSNSVNNGWCALRAIQPIDHNRIKIFARPDTLTHVSLLCYS